MTLRAGLLASAVVLLAWAATLDRVPIAWSDETLYASIALSLQRGDGGIPSVLRATRSADDHVRFYGPVFFGAAAAMFDLFGLSLASFRLVSLIGALAVAAGGALMTAAFGESRARQAWVFTLLLLTPELGSAASGGRMDSLAVGLALLGLAVSINGLLRGRTALHGVAAGTLMALAALTTPRILPFTAAFLAASLVLAFAAADKAMRGQAAAGITVCAAIAAAWAVYAHGGPVRWVAYLTGIVSAVDVDIAVTPTAVRDWRIAPWTLVSPIAAVAGGLAAARTFTRGAADGWTPARTAVAFALAVTWMNLVAAISLANGTFAFGVYFAIPLLAVVAALSPRWIAPGSAAWPVLFLALIGVCASVRVAKYVGAAATWSARDPQRMEQFVRDTIPPDSDVYGLPSYYFYAVERSGSRMLSAVGRSEADWTERARDDVRIQAPHAADDGHRRFLLWPVDEYGAPVPRRFDCARASRVALYVAPAASAPHWVEPIVARLGTTGYPSSALYALDAGCPVEEKLIAIDATSGATATSR